MSKVYIGNDETEFRLSTKTIVLSQEQEEELRPLFSIDEPINSQIEALQEECAQLKIENDKLLEENQTFTAKNTPEWISYDDFIETVVRYNKDITVGSLLKSKANNKMIFEISMMSNIETLSVWLEENFESEVGKDIAQK